MPFRRALAVLPLLATTFAPQAHAALIRYDWSGDTGTMTGSGYWLFDEADVTPGANLTGLLQGWSFQWGPSGVEFSLDSTTAIASVSTFQLLSGSTAMGTHLFCASPNGTCGSFWTIAINGPSALSDFWLASITPFTTAAGFGTVGAPMVVSVPEPGTLLLLSGGLAGLAFVRQRRRHA